jgi:serine/threonine protein kinase
VWPCRAFGLFALQQHYNEKEARDVIRCCLDAIVYMHDQNVAHRDLKVSGRVILVMFCSISAAQVHPRVLLGIVWAMQHTMHTMLSSCCGVPYAAGEENLPL